MKRLQTIAAASLAILCILGCTMTGRSSELHPQEQPETDKIQIIGQIETPVPTPTPTPTPEPEDAVLAVTPEPVENEPMPTLPPTPTPEPTAVPTSEPTQKPTEEPVGIQSQTESASTSTPAPTAIPTRAPTQKPTSMPTERPTAASTAGPTTAITSPTDTPESTAEPETEQTKADEFCEFALTLLDAPYRRSGTDPEKGFDPGGFIYYCLTGVGENVKHKTSKGYAENERWERLDSLKDLQPGDLCFFMTPGNESVNCVTIYLGDDMMIYPSSGEGKVIVNTIKSKYWKDAFVFARRVF